jgi:hypothetical protein
MDPVGKKVLCMEGQDAFNLKKGETYTIESVHKRDNDVFYVLKELDPTFTFFATRFKILEEEKEVKTKELEKEEGQFTLEQYIKKVNSRKLKPKKDNPDENHHH